MKDKVVIVLLVCNLILSSISLNHGHHQHPEQTTKQSQKSEVGKVSNDDRVINTISQMIYMHEQNCSTRESVILSEIIRIQDKLGMKIDPRFERMIPNKEGKITEVGKKETL